MRQLEDGAVIDGRYEISAHLGSGGMAEVYCAKDMQLGRNVALKILHRALRRADEEFVERFRREASSAAGLQHPHVVGVYDRGEWDGTSYIAMEFVAGPHAEADHRRARRRSTRSARSTLTVQILRAARFAHRRGIIHRDFKPQNVIVDDEGRAKVTDFGIARAGASDMTQTGSILGTAQYLSPEQAQGHAVGARSDLYSIGIILYELLTGRVPFEARVGGDHRAQAGLRGAGAAEPSQPARHARARGRRAARAGQGAARSLRRRRRVHRLARGGRLADPVAARDRRGGGRRAALPAAAAGRGAGMAPPPSPPRRRRAAAGPSTGVYPVSASPRRRRRPAAVGGGGTGRKRWPWIAPAAWWRSGSSCCSVAPVAQDA